jgi:hypothetical protein
MRLGGLVVINHRYRGKPVTPNPRRRLDFSVSTGDEPNPERGGDHEAGGVKSTSQPE